MTMGKAIAVAVAALIGPMQIAGCASEPASRSTGRVVDDAAITAKVKAADIARGVDGAKDI